MNSSETLTVSIIIPTKNRPDDLELCVQTILRQTLLPRELIVIDQSDGEESRSRVESQIAKASPEVRNTLKLVYIHDKSLAGCAVAKNLGMDLAGGFIWVFLDDDVELEPDFLEEILAAYNDDPGLTGVSGTITNYCPPSWAFRIWNWIFFHGPFHDERQPIYWNSDKLRKSSPIPVRKFSGGAMSLRAEAIGGTRFDRHLHGIPGGEDVEFCESLPQGARLVIAPRARLVHNQSILGRTRSHFLRRLTHTAHFLYRKHWRTGISNRLSFVWLNVGIGLAASMASLRRLSLDPWRAVKHGLDDARDATPKKPPQ